MSLYGTGTHPLVAEFAAKGAQYNLPVTIEKGAWLERVWRFCLSNDWGEFRNQYLQFSDAGYPANVVALCNPCR